MTPSEKRQRRKRLLLRKKRSRSGSGRRPMQMLKRAFGMYVSGKRSGNKKREMRARVMIGRLVRKYPKLRYSKGYKRYLAKSGGITAGTAAPQGWLPIRSTYRPQFQDQAAESPEGEVISDPDEYEDLPDKDEDYSMDGYGKFALYAEGSDMFQKALMFAGYGGLAASFFIKKKKQQNQARMIGIGALGFAFARHFLMKKKIAEVGNFGALEIMDGLGDYGSPGSIHGVLGSPGDPAIVSG